MRRVSGRPRPITRSAAARSGSCRAAGRTSSSGGIGSQIKTGLTIRVPGKVVFLVPWAEHWLIGTTDALFEGPPARPIADGWEVDRLLDTVNATLDVTARAW